MKTILLNEFYGPTLQGEGPMIGRPCYFIRLHGCPVKCPGCDTAFTWNGTETGTPLPIYSAEKEGEDPSLSLKAKVARALSDHPRCGFILTGGEPLLHYQNQTLRSLIDEIQTANSWIALETSGFIAREPLPPEKGEALLKFLQDFNSISLSPKITPCLHGEWSDQELLANLSIFCHPTLYYKVAIKLVVKDQADLDAADRFHQELGRHTFPRPLLYIMPFGQEPGEILNTCRWLVPHLADRGWTLSPRLHSILWGKERRR